MLFAWVLCTHAFDVPARRDVAYSLAGSAALMAVAAAQSVDLTLGVYVVAWVACGVWGLVAMWQSMSGSEGVPWRHPGGGRAGRGRGGRPAGGRPAGTRRCPPRSSSPRRRPTRRRSTARATSPTAPASLPAHAASPTGRTGVGGFLGFAKSLDTGVRASLGNQVVMRVRASRPSFWVGQTYDTWNGQSWVQTGEPTSGRPRRPSWRPARPFDHPPGRRPAGRPVAGTTDVQTFYLAQSGPNLVFHADNAQRVYLQSQALFLTGDGTIVSTTSMGAGTVYTVVSTDTTATRRPAAAATVPGTRRAVRRVARLAALERPATCNSPTPTRGWPPWPARSPPGSAPRR